MISRIKYTCKNCGWSTSIAEQWKDLKPKRCMNRKCNTSFRKSPESLATDAPIEKVSAVVSKEPESRYKYRNKSRHKEEPKDEAKDEETNT